MVNSFNPSDQSSEIMTLTEMPERHLCVYQQCPVGAVSSLNTYHPEDKAARFHPPDQSPRLPPICQLLWSYPCFLSYPLPLTGAVETRREYNTANLNPQKTTVECCREGRWQTEA